MWSRVWEGTGRLVDIHSDWANLTDDHVLLSVDVVGRPLNDHASHGTVITLCSRRQTRLPIHTTRQSQTADFTPGVSLPLLVNKASCNPRRILILYRWALVGIDKVILAVTPFSRRLGIYIIHHTANYPQNRKYITYHCRRPLILYCWTTTLQQFTWRRPAMLLTIFRVKLKSYLFRQSYEDSVL